MTRLSVACGAVITSVERSGSVCMCRHMCVWVCILCLHMVRHQLCSAANTPAEQIYHRCNNSQAAPSWWIIWHTHSASILPYCFLHIICSSSSHLHFSVYLQYFSGWNCITGNNCESSSNSNATKWFAKNIKTGTDCCRICVVYFILWNGHEKVLRPPTRTWIWGKQTAAAKQWGLSNQINLCFHEPHEKGLHLQNILDYVWSRCSLQFKLQRAVKRWKLGIWVCMMERCWWTPAGLHVTVCVNAQHVS